LTRPIDPKKIDRRIYNKPPVGAGGPRDGLVCRIDEIMPIIDEFIERHRAEHPLPDDVSTHTLTHYGADSAISFMMGLSERGISTRAIRRQSLISFERADRILSAIGQEHAFQDGRVHVIPNPTWSQERWLAWKEEQGCI
jgi:hypothetical protein